MADKCKIQGLLSSICFIPYIYRLEIKHQLYKVQVGISWFYDWDSNPEKLISYIALNI